MFSNDFKTSNIMAKLEDVNYKFKFLQITLVRNSEFIKTKEEIDENPAIESEEEDAFRLEDYLNLILLELQSEHRTITKIIPCILGVDPDVIFIIHHKGKYNVSDEE